jgi:LysM repeat protein/phage baseplate assembly protein W
MPQFEDYDWTDRSFAGLQGVNNDLMANVLGSGLSVEYLLSTHDETMVTISTIALPRVTSFQLERNQAIDVAFTLGDKVIREHAGVRRQMVTISGRSGIEHRLGQDRSGNALFGSGIKLFQEFEEFLENYEADMQWNTSRRRTGSLHPKNTASDDLSGGKASFLILRAPFEKKKYLAEPLGFTFNRDAGTSRNSYTYTLRLMLYAVPESQTPKQSLLGNFQVAMEYAAAAVDAAAATIMLVDQNAKLYTQTASSVLRAPIRAATRMMTAIDSFAGTARATALIPRDVFMDLLTLFDHMALAGFHIIDALPLGQYDRDFLDFMNGVQDFRINAMSAMGAMGLGDFPTLVFIPTTDPPVEPLPDVEMATLNGPLGSTQTLGQSAYVPYVCGANETLESISKKTGIPESEIAALNKMLHWDIGPHGIPLQTGSVIYLPSGAPVSVSEGDMDIYKTDLLLENGDLAISPVNKNDVLVVKGVTNLKQGLTTRLLTEEGEVAMFPFFGLPRLVGEPLTLTNIGLAASAAETQLLLDNRISSVTGVQVVDSADSLLLFAEAVPVGGSPVELTIPFSVD